MRIIDEVQGVRKNAIKNHGNRDALKTQGDEIISGQDDSCIDNGTSSSFFIDD